MIKLRIWITEVLAGLAQNVKCTHTSRCFFWILAFSRNGRKHRDASAIFLASFIRQYPQILRKQRKFQDKIMAVKIMILKKFIILPSIILTSLKHFICYQAVFVFRKLFKKSLPKLIDLFCEFQARKSWVFSEKRRMKNC